MLLRQGDDVPKLGALVTQQVGWIARFRSRNIFFFSAVFYGLVSL